MPLITISRQFGAGGSALAARVAEALGWTLLDDALLDEVARRLGTPREVVAVREERAPSLVARLAAALTLAAPADAEPAVAAGAQRDAAPDALADLRIGDTTQRVILEAAARGPVVIVGRGAQAALAERSDALHVLCCASRTARVERVMAREGCGAEEAARRVDAVDRERDQFVRQRWGRERLAPANYDLCVNTALLGLDEAAALVLHAARARFGG